MSNASRTVCGRGSKRETLVPEASPLAAEVWFARGQDPAAMGRYPEARP